MTNHIVELAQIKLAEGKTENDLLKASEAFQEKFLNYQEGFIRREMVRKSDGAYVDIVHWRSQEDADATMQLAESSQAVHDFFSVMDFDPQSPETGVDHCISVATFTRL